ncbi:filament-like plant protein 4 [Diospyros lotus]|uniref:filament-like plant protein 4 n=1 Tax=Diospyros lotus TaxID=55363 RepID=UPI0022510C55|nr:filament-like plant protein 4 [Diospyros lotus]XP_052196489.1 filament-like plant protein 4 [Diospyros lotus]
MDHKTWLWKKKSTEKAIVADKVNISHKGNGEEIQTLLNDKAELERNLKTLNEELSSAISECNAKDYLVETHAKMAQEALSAWEKAEAETTLLKQELSEIMQQRVAGEERLTHLDMALKECMQQLRFVREEQEQRIHDAMVKTTREFEKARSVLEERLANANKRLAKLGAENTQLSKALLTKEKTIEIINERRAQAEADFNALMTRLESTKKENSSLKYEVRVLEKELEIRNEEREFNRRTTDVVQKQQQESAKKIAKLESECQRLRVLVRKRLPGPAALARMNNEVEMLVRYPSETRREKLNHSPASCMNFAVDSTPDAPSKRTNHLYEQLYAMEAENRHLKEALSKKANELQFFRTMYARTASKLSQGEAQLGQIVTETARDIPVQNELSIASMSDMGSDDKVSCAESWASALISELEHFRNGKQMHTPSQGTAGASEIDLMDDFLEMEKLATVSMDKPFGSSDLASVEEGGPLEIQSARHSLVVEDLGIVPLPDSMPGLCVLNGDAHSKYVLISKFPTWLQDILKVVLEHHHVAQRKPDHILEDIKFALQYVNNTNSSDIIDANECSNGFSASNHSDLSGYVSWKPPDQSPFRDSAKRRNGDEISPEKKTNGLIQSHDNKSVCKIIELIEGISLSSLDYGTSEMIPVENNCQISCKNSETSSGYMIRVLQWKTSELTTVLQQFIKTCNDLLVGKADLEKFTEEIASALDWVMNHCFSLQDVSSMKDAIKKHLDWDESQSESEVECETTGQFSEADKTCTHKEQLSYMHVLSSWNDHKLGEIQPTVREESENLKDESANMEPADKDTSIIQPHEPEKIMKSLQSELEAVKESEVMIENPIENNKSVNEDLDAQLKFATVELNKASQKLSSLKTKLEHKNTCCQKLEATCVDPQLQLERVTEKEIPKYDVVQEEKQLQADWEIAAASEKLAECQETILGLGKQLKALASPGDATLFDKLVSNPLYNNVPTTMSPKKGTSQRTSLLDKILDEDKAVDGDVKLRKTKEVFLSEPQKSPTVLDSNSFSACHSNKAINSQESSLYVNGSKHNVDEAVGDSFAIVPRKRKGTWGLLKTLLWRRNKGNRNK